MEKIDPVFMEMIAGLITILGSVNAFFIARLIRKIEESSIAVIDFKKDLQHLHEKISELSNLTGRFIELEKKIAILEYKSSRPSRGKSDPAS